MGSIWAPPIGVEGDDMPENHYLVAPKSVLRGLFFEMRCMPCCALPIRVVMHGYRAAFCATHADLQ